MRKTLLSTTLALGVFVTLGNPQSLEAVILQPVASPHQQEQLILARHGGGHTSHGESAHSRHRHGYGWYGGYGVVNEEDSGPNCPYGKNETTFGTICIEGPHSH
jgi:hypothetical protein